jgi:hypothetical protein
MKMGRKPVFLNASSFRFLFMLKALSYILKLNMGLADASASCVAFELCLCMVLPNVDYIVFERGLVDISFVLVIVSCLKWHRYH